MYVSTLSLIYMELPKLILQKPWGEGPNDLDLDRYCNLLALDLEEITSSKLARQGWFTVPTLAFTASGSTTPKPDIKGSIMNVEVEQGEDIYD